jgi:hypothetical protein
LANLKEGNFEGLASDIFDYQSIHNPLYSKYLELLGRPSSAPHFLPISFFKSHAIQTGIWEAQTEFSSSGTTGQTPSKHMVRDLSMYLENSVRGFDQFYGDPADWVILALLPSYLERGGSSLVAMADHLIRLSKYMESGFFLDDFQQLNTTLNICKSKGYKTILLGVSYALLDFAAQFPSSLQGITIMETGGMKGRRKEMTKTELHEALQNAFQVEAIHSEYGMTELFSQAYAMGSTRFYPAQTMRVCTRELNDPFCPVPFGKTGVLNITDLANLDTCSFIQTEDLGRVWPDGSFEVLGRADAAEIRGCNLMVE